MKKISKLRKIALDQIEQVQVQTQIEYDGYPGQGEHRIQAIYNGEEIGYLTFSEKGNNTISIDDGQVSPNYEGYELEELLLDRFGYILEGDYPNFGVEPHFNSPEFENTFRRLVGQGLIPSQALDNTKVTRNYDDEAQMRHQDYQDSLPDSIKAKRNSRLKKGVIK